MLMQPHRSCCWWWWPRVTEEWCHDVMMMVGVKVQPAQARCVGGPAQPGRHQETRHSSLCGRLPCAFMSIARHIQYILKHIELTIYGAHFSRVTSLYNCTNNKPDLVKISLLLSTLTKVTIWLGTFDIYRPAGLFVPFSAGRSKSNFIRPSLVTDGESG